MPELSEDEQIEPLEDTPEHHEVLDREVIAEGRIFSFVRETFDYRGVQIQREYVQHPGAVAVIAIDDDDRVLAIQQYRHPIRGRSWELPAGLLDIAGESLLHAAQRELAEEADMRAVRWNVLLDLNTSAGGSDEVVRVFLARGLSSVTTDFVRDEEEADILVRWVPLDELADATLGGHVKNAILVAGVLAALAARAKDWTMLRPADASNA
jgi:8-oxo-dGDP phosphatase